MRLRALEPADLDLLYTIENDITLWHTSSQTAPYSRYQLREYIASNGADIYKDEQVRFVIEEDGRAVGLIDLFNFSPYHHRAELGIALLREVQGRGIAQQAIAAIEDYARNIVGLHQIYAIVEASNTRSVAMLERYGFRCTNELKDWIRMGEKYENALLMQLFLRKY